MTARRLLTWWLVVSAGGCWTEEPLIHGAFTAEQWAHLQTTYAPPEKPPAPCSQSWPGVADCAAAMRLGQQLFFEPRLSGPWVKNADGIEVHPTGKTSCATCHDAGNMLTPGWFVDTRPNSPVSQGAQNPTPHNTISVVNVYVGDRESYTWTGQCEKRPCQTPTNVVRDIALPKAMKSDSKIRKIAILGEPAYRGNYLQAFTDPLFAMTDANIELALDLYMRALVSLDAPFDRFIVGIDDAISDSAKRGFALFVGKAMCSECHSGSMFTDQMPRVTGVEDSKLDSGFQGTGGFYTPGLRHVAKTGPYMHNGWLQTLADVIDFYKWGGNGVLYVGRKDPLMHPFDLDPDEAQDLAAFMEALTGAALPAEIRADTHVPAPPPVQCSPPQAPGNPGLVCDGACKDIANDPRNCGACGITCSSYCMGGLCGP